MFVIRVIESVWDMDTDGLLEFIELEVDNTKIYLITDTIGLFEEKFGEITNAILFATADFEKAKKYWKKHIIEPNRQVLMIPEELYTNF